jgi:hypothetical protein
LIWLIVRAIALAVLYHWWSGNRRVPFNIFLPLVDALRAAVLQTINQSINQSISK